MTKVLRTLGTGFFINAEEGRVVHCSAISFKKLENNSFSVNLYPPPVLLFFSPSKTNPVDPH